MPPGPALCYKCRRPLSAEDFQAGAALQIGSLAACDACADALLERLTPEQRRAALRKREEAMRAAGITDDAPAPPAHAPRLAHRRPPTLPAPAEPAGPARPFPVRIVAAVATGVLVVAIAFLALRGGSPPVPEPPVPVPSPARAATARPEREAVPPETAPAAKDVTAEQKRELDEVDRMVQAAAQEQQYRKALDLLEGVRARHKDPAWLAAMDERRKTNEEGTRRYFDWVKAQALEAQRDGIASGVARWRDAVAAWGLPAYAAELDQALSASGQPLPLAEPDRAALRQLLARRPPVVLPGANSRAMTRLKAMGIEPAPLTWEQVVDTGRFTPEACPVAVYAGNEPYQPTVRSPHDVPAALIRYVRAGGTLAFFPSGPWPLYCDERRTAIAHLTAPLLPLSVGNEPSAGASVAFAVVDRRALPHVPATFRFPADGDRRWRPVQPGQAKGGSRVVPLVELRDASGTGLGLGAAWIHVDRGRVLYVWFRLLDLPEGDALFHDLWQAILAKPEAPR
jgi:hypothetical protein